MARIEKTVFISYRRKDISWALAVYQYLTGQKYDVFFDYTSLPSGDFEQNILSNIRARAHFVVILTPTALDRCSQPGDWLRREIETAIDEKRNIIPLFFDGFNFGSPSVAEKLTGKLATFNSYNGIDIPMGYFTEAMERLRSNRFLNKALDTVIQPVPAEVRKVVEDEQIAATKALSTLELFIPEYTPPPAKVKPWMFGGIEFVKVPHGEFVMGSRHDNPLALDHEKPQHELNIPYDFLMARFPVMNEQFAEFVKENHYSTLAEEQGFGWVLGNNQWEKVKGASWRHPQGPNSSIEGIMHKHPVVQVAWMDAVKFYDWLNTKFGNEVSGVVFRAPTEAEWEKAARGTDGREWPWGNEFISTNCNSKESGTDCTTPIGFHSPQGDSPFGVSDMSGNVWEWTASLWKKRAGPEEFKYPYSLRDGRESMNARDDTWHVLRGGSFQSQSQHIRSAARDILKSISIRNDNCGLRVVLGPQLP